MENRRLISRVRTYFRRLEAAVAEGDTERISAEHLQLVSAIDRAVQRGAMHRNTGSRRKSLAARVAARAS